MAITPKQARFVQEYLIDLNATQAAIRAGYKPSRAEQTGCDLVRNRKVAEAIQAAQGKRAEKAEVNAQWVLERLIQNADRAAAVVAVTDREGNPTGWYQYEGSVVNRSLELIGKHIGMFTDRLEISGRDGGPLVTEVVIEHHSPPVGPAPVGSGGG
jgi:phage terminase small subunit